MNLTEKHFYEFGPFRLDVEEGQLLRAEQEIPLTPKAFQLLQMLVENSGHVLDKETLMQHVWADTVVEEKNLADNISILRKVLGDDPKEPRYIKTVPRRGYRFVAEVRAIVEESERLLVRERESARLIIEEDDTVRVADAGELEVIARRSLPAQERRRFSPLIVVGALVLALGLAFATYAFWKNRNTANTPLARSIAVLPFKPLVAASADPALELGITDALISKLSNIRQIVVRPTNSVLKYSADGQDLRIAGNELEVDVLLDGRVQKVGERIRLSVQLVRAADGVPIWADTFDEPFKDVFAVQDAISERVAQALAFQLTSDERSRIAKHGTANPEAYQSYLMGRFFWNKRTKDDLFKSADYFQKAIAADPNYALAYAGLADTQYLLGWRRYVAPDVAYPEALRLARKALEIDNELAEAHTPIARIKAIYEHDFAGSEREFKRALELNPRYATAHHWYSRLLLKMGRFDESLMEARKARELDPLSLIINNNLAEVLYYAQRFDESLQTYRRTREMDKNFNTPVVSIFHYLIYLRKGLYDEAITEYANSLQETTGDEKRKMIELSLKKAFESGQERGLRLKQIELLSKEAASDPNFTMLMADAYRGLGDNDQTIAWLRKAAEARHPAMVLIELDPDFQHFRGDPRFAELVRNSS